MFGLADLKKINERAAAKDGRHVTHGGLSVYRRPDINHSIATADTWQLAQEIADALNLADAVKEANENAVGRT